MATAVMPQQSHNNNNNNSNSNSFTGNGTSIRDIRNLDSGLKDLLRPTTAEPSPTISSSAASTLLQLHSHDSDAAALMLLRSNHEQRRFKFDLDDRHIDFEDASKNRLAFGIVPSSAPAQLQSTPFNQHFSWSASDVTSSLINSGNLMHTKTSPIENLPLPGSDLQRFAYSALFSDFTDDCCPRKNGPKILKGPIACITDEKDSRIPIEIPPILSSKDSPSPCTIMEKLPAHILQQTKIGKSFSSAENLKTNIESFIKDYNRFRSTQLDHPEVAHDLRRRQQKKLGRSILQTKILEPDKSKPRNLSLFDGCNASYLSTLSAPSSSVNGPSCKTTSNLLLSVKYQEQFQLKPVVRRRSRPVNHFDPVCHSCNTKETPEWRRGPDGPRTLCNACGLYYSKLLKRAKSIPDISTRVASNKSAPNSVHFVASAQQGRQISNHESRSENTLYTPRQAHDIPSQPTSAGSFKDGVNASYTYHYNPIDQPSQPQTLPKNHSATLTNYKNHSRPASCTENQGMHTGNGKNYETVFDEISQTELKSNTHVYDDVGNQRVSVHSLLND